MSDAQQIVALGGGGFAMEDNPALDRYVLRAARSTRPRICFIPTASGDSDNSFGAKLAPLAGLGLLGGSNCPFYDGTAEKRPAYHQMIRDGMPPGIATDIGVALHYVDGALHRVVSSRPNARAYRVGLDGDRVDEGVIEPELLGADGTAVAR